MLQILLVHLNIRHTSKNHTEVYMQIVILLRGYLYTRYIEICHRIGRTVSPH